MLSFLWPHAALNSKCGSYALFIKSSCKNNNLVTCLFNDSFSTLHLQVIWFSMDWTFKFGLVCPDRCKVFISSCNGTLYCLSLEKWIQNLAWYRKITICLKNWYLRQIIRHTIASPIIDRTRVSYLYIIGVTWQLQYI